MFNKLPELTKDWWPVVTSIMVIISLLYTGLTHIIHNESKNIIKSDVLPHFEKMNEILKDQEELIDRLVNQNNVSNAKLDILIQMLD